MDLSEMIRNGLSGFSIVVMAAALYFYFKGIRFSKTALLGAIVVLNLIFSTPVLFDVTHHHGVDYPAYLQ